MIFETIFEAKIKFTAIYFSLKKLFRKILSANFHRQKISK